MRITVIFFLIYSFWIEEAGANIIGRLSGEESTGVDSGYFYNNLGIASFRAGDFEAAGNLFLKSLRHKKIKQEPLSSDMASTYTNLGVVRRRLFNNDDAMHYYDTAGYIYLRHYGPDYFNLGAVYLNQGNILREKRDLNSALSYYNNALRIFTSNEMTGWIATVYNNIGIAYELKGDYEQAIEYYYKSIDLRNIVEPSAVAIPAGNLAICYKETGDLDKADQYYRIALEAISENQGKNHTHYATNLLNYGLFLVTHTGEYEVGRRLLHEALEIYRENYGDKGHLAARTLMNIGYSFEKSGELDSALRYYHLSIVANTESFELSDYYDNPGPDEKVFSSDYLLSSLKHKAYILYLKSYVRDKRFKLEASLSAFGKAMEIIENMRMRHQTEESRILLTANEHETYMQAIHVAWKLYELTNEPEYAERAFMLSERSKAASLLSSIRDVEARSFGGVPDELLIAEEDLKKRVAAYRALIYEEQRNVAVNNERISLWQERVFSIELELRQLISRLEEEYPNYYYLKYQQNLLDIKAVRDKLGGRDAMISYVYNDSLVYIFSVTNRQFNFYSAPTGGLVESKLEMLLDVLTRIDPDRNLQESFLGLTGSSRYFYDLLIAPVNKDIKGKRLIIVPDGLFAYVPFELLLTSDPASNTVNYRHLPYLLKDFVVSYSYSATLWKESTSKSSGAARRLLAMAPGYEFFEIPQPGPVNVRQYYRDRLTPLPGARQEAIDVTEIMNGKLLLGNEASERNFKELAGDFKILHLAMHTLIDDENPMFSKLVFSEPLESDEDGLLNTYEIYNMGLNAGLAVLSSCRSGYGILHRGEGVMSLARGFIYAGVPSIVMTFWEIEDKSGAEIMTAFYRYLLKGYRKDEALRLARIDFLESADMLKAHPYFWGAYVCIGNPEELFRSYRRFYPYLVFLVIVPLLIGVIRMGKSPVTG